MDNIIATMRDQLQTRLDHASQWRQTRNSTRNNRAYDAAQDHVIRAGHVMDLVRDNRTPSEVLQALRVHHEYAVVQERQLRQSMQHPVAKHRNGYARENHEVAARTYDDAIRAIQNLQIAPIPGAAVSGLKLVLATDGSGRGTYNRSIRLFQGYQSGVALSTETRNRVEAEATAAGNIFAAQLTARFGAQMSRLVMNANEYKMHSASEDNMSLDGIDISQPTNIYQLLTTVPMQNAPAVQLFGGTIVSSKSLVA